MLIAMERLSYPIPSRLIYSALWCGLFPVLLLAIFIRSIRQPGYRRNLGERFGFYPLPSVAPIWLHAASLGEVKAAAPLLETLRSEHPTMPLLITCQTPAGRLAAAALPFNDCHAVYLPFDVGWMVRRFLRHFKPRIALVFETEIWPVLFLEVRRSGMPLMIINARMTGRSLTRYSRVGGVFRAALALPDIIACQNRENAARYLQAGASAEALCVTGNIKWDFAPDRNQVDQTKAQRAAWPQRPVWMAASTHELEEAAVLKMHAALSVSHPHALLLWAPRHPERFGAVASQAEALGYSCTRRSLQAWPDSRTQIFIIDTLGELTGFMPCADVVFVGGSLQAIGGHNVMEPAAYGKPILVGPYTSNFSDSVEALKLAGGLLQCTDAETMQIGLLELLADEAKRVKMAKANADAMAENQGALEKTKALISQRLC
jgi:3-deoxy-D-manno-octulosonic-acid transferase